MQLNSNRDGAYVLKYVELYRHTKEADRYFILAFMILLLLFCFYKEVD